MYITEVRNKTSTSVGAEANRTCEARGRIDVISWAIRVASWDGLLPTFVISVPFLIDRLMPNNRALNESIGVNLPLAAFVIRLFVGTGHVWSNGCCRAIRVLQCGLLWFAVLVLAFVDAMLILAQQQGLSVNPKAFLITASIHLPCVIVAMYPGRNRPSRSL
jgi:hypothetical protein